MKKLITIMLIAILTATTVAAAKPQDITVIIDGREVVFPDAKPFINKKNRTMVPIRFISEELGAEVEWNEETQTVTIYSQDPIELKVNDNTALIDGYYLKSFDTMTIIQNDRTLVPLRFVSELLFCDVDWIDETKTVDITSPKPIDETISIPEPQVEIRYPDTIYDGNRMYIHITNLREYVNCDNYEFRINFTNVPLNEIDQYKGDIAGVQRMSLNKWKKLNPYSHTDIYSLKRIFYTTLENKETFRFEDNMTIQFTISVKKLCSGEVKDFDYTMDVSLPYPVEDDWGI